MYFHDDIVCDHTISKIGFLFSVNTPSGCQYDLTTDSTVCVVGVGVSAMQMLQPWKIEQNSPLMALSPFKGNLEDRKDADVSRKQSCLPRSLNRRIMLLLG